MHVHVEQCSLSTPATEKAQEKIKETIALIYVPYKLSKVAYTRDGLSVSERAIIWGSPMHSSLE